MLLVAAALAAEPAPVVEVHGAPGFRRGSADVAGWFSARGGLLLAEHWEPGVVVEGATEPRVGGRFDLRWMPGDVLDGRASALIGVTGGAWWTSEGIQPAGGPELGVELPLGPMMLHLDAVVLFGAEQVGVVGAGVGWRKRRPAPEPVTPAPRPRSGTMLWVPHPWCEWIPIEESAEPVAGLPPGARVRVARPGYLPVEVDVSALDGVQLEPLPAQGALTVAASGGDLVHLGGRDAGADEEGAVSMLASEGVVRLEVRGGGRKAAQVVAVSAGRALWVDVPDPPPHYVYFSVRSSVIAAEDRSTIQAFVRDAGAWRFVVSGSASPEGAVAENVELARSRAQAVRDALVAAGLPEAQVSVGESFVPDPALPPEEQRSARIIAVEAP